ncbi:MAG: type II toxin-antitoxin system RelE/ParE family toxin [Myxococcaceae bacterium]|nr:type II toxin-antitoxin system RelE/ParE family toxin [Myxococcaceae bacterium]
MTKLSEGRLPAPLLLHGKSIGPARRFPSRTQRFFLNGYFYFETTPEVAARRLCSHDRRAWWRDYRTAAGGRPIRDFFDELTDEEAAEVLAAMKEVADIGSEAARHLRGDIYEVRAEARTRTFRVLFAGEGQFSQVLLSLVAFVKKTQRTDCANGASEERRKKPGSHSAYAMSLTI